VDNIPQRIGKYTVLREIGRGASGVVYLSRDEFADRDVAVKFFSHGEHGALQGQQRAVFLNEAALVGKLSHPHIVRLLDVVVEDDFSYIVMEYVHGGTLSTYTAADRLLSPERVVEIVFKISRALDYMHRNGIIHRDIKPANILITDHFDVKVSDFGIAVFPDITRTTLSNVGSPAYMSPEQVQDEPLTHQTDIYSLGVAFYHLLSGRLPFAGSSYASLIYQIINVDPPPLRKLRPGLPEGFEEIVSRALQKDTSIRYQSWMEFGADLAMLVRDLRMPSEEFTDTRKFHILRSLSFFRLFKEIETWETLRAATWHRFAGGTVLIREGDPGDALYILVEGEASVSRGGVPLAMLGPGDCYGEMLYFMNNNGARSTTIVTTKQVQVIEIKAAVLSGMTDACQAQFSKACMHLLIQRLTKANQLISAGR
jgi:eukaryotic-like serine/threonine-protein kinase